MKTKRALCFIMLFGLLVAGCAPAGNPSPSGQVSPTSGAVSDNPTTNPSKLTVEQTIVSLKDLDERVDDIKSFLPQIDKFSIADDAQITFPKGVEAYYDVTLSYPPQESFEDFYSQCVAFVEYALGEKSNPNAFFYHGENSDYQHNYETDPNTGSVTIDGKPVEDPDEMRTIGPPNKVADYYDKLVSGEEDWYAIEYSTEFLTGDSVYFAFQNPIGFSYLRINKGKVSTAVGRTDRHLVSWLPVFAEAMTAHTPDSTLEIDLPGGKTTIAEAAKRCEEYLNNLPAKAKNTDFAFCVSNVQTFAVKDKVGIRLPTTVAYKGMPFEAFNLFGNSFSEYSDKKRYETIYMEAYMIDPNEVDTLYNYISSYVSQEKARHTELVGLKGAIIAVAKELTKEIPFEIQSAELAYVMTEPTSGKQDATQDVTLAWKITLFSPNDNMTYVAYVDAQDGGNMRYFTIYPES